MDRTNVYSIAFLYVLSIFIVCILLFNFFVALCFLGVSVFVTGLGSYGKCGYTAHRRKEKWVRKNGTVCYARKWKWEASPEKIPPYTILAIFLTIYSLCTIPFIVITFL